MYHTCIKCNWTSVFTITSKIAVFEIITPDLKSLATLLQFSIIIIANLNAIKHTHNYT